MHDMGAICPQVNGTATARVGLKNAFAQELLERAPGIRSVPGSS